MNVLKRVSHSRFLNLFLFVPNLGPEIVPITCHSFVNHQIQGNFQNLQRGPEIWPCSSTRSLFFYSDKSWYRQKVPICICFYSIYIFVEKLHFFGKKVYICKMLGRIGLILKPNTEGPLLTLFLRLWKNNLVSRGEK